jgi:hypothetical protein
MDYPFEFVYAKVDLSTPNSYVLYASECAKSIVKAVEHWDEWPEEITRTNFELWKEYFPKSVIITLGADSILISPVTPSELPLPRGVYWDPHKKEACFVDDQIYWPSAFKHLVLLNMEDIRIELMNIACAKLLDIPEFARVYMNVEKMRENFEPVTHIEVIRQLFPWYYKELEEKILKNVKAFEM